MPPRRASNEVGRPLARVPGPGGVPVERGDGEPLGSVNRPCKALSPKQLRAAVLIARGDEWQEVCDGVGITSDTLEIWLTNGTGHLMEVAISDAKRRLSNVLDCQAIKWLGSQIRRTDDDVSDAHKLACVRELGSKLAAERQADNYIFAQHLAKKRVNAILDELAAKRRDREDAKRAEREGSAGVTIVPADSDQWLAEAMRPSSGPEAFL